ncbi:MAG: MBL fold metallo-hydrolase [Lachnospiraceae bacterium]|nr:MBL fold metallo-hydrolase [Lachnospiraceae bacterium]MDD3614893.1 MBL fold metallo-hydrolase [Lachnospiraceae bacterium]
MNYYTSEKINENLTLIRSISGELMYLLESEDSCALIDSCVGVGHLKAYVETLTDKPVTLFLTHGHIDHAMGAPDFEKVYMNHKDIPLYQSQCSVEERKGYVMGCAGVDVAQQFKDEDYTKVQPDKEFENLQDGDTFKIGDFHLDCYEFPGHTPGAVVFLIREMGILILGDACNNSTFVFDENSAPLDIYRENVIFNNNRLKGKYTRVFLSHHDMETDTQIMENVITVCDEALAGKADDLPFEFMGMKAYIAKKCNERFQREDGKSGNIIYNKTKLHQSGGK